MSKKNDWKKAKELWRECTSCKIGSIVNHRVFGSGSIYAPAMIVGESPGRTEDSSGRPFTGQAGTILREIVTGVCERAGIMHPFYTNQICCRPVDGAGFTREANIVEMVKCRTKFFTTLRIVAPERVLLLGMRANSQLSTIISEVPALEGRIFVIPQPGYLLRKWAEEGKHAKHARDVAEYTRLLEIFMTAPVEQVAAQLAPLIMRRNPPDESKG